MRLRSTLLSCLALVATTYALPAAADVSPPDACLTQGPGKACSNAGPNYDEPGVCTFEIEQRPGPDGSISSGDIICELPDASSSDAAPSEDAAPLTEDAALGVDAGSETGTDGGAPAATTAAPSSNSGGCQYSAGTTKGVTGLAMFLVGITALAFARRRRA